ncbi:hypothetical protein NW768_004044 [Fusarium equiseti]|uniref:Uncharacterized protein n=1 Tax=Fusarium equiseti TaxID=61235 RepID=A0ABQ8RJC2_FUSEQ|nr:hypothetical protein NW768_004044 [Fusarium equiseti]
MQSQGIDQAKQAGPNKDASDETSAGGSEYTSFNHKARELVTKSREISRIASTLAESAEAATDTIQAMESTDLARYKTDGDELMA